MKHKTVIATLFVLVLGTAWAMNGRQVLDFHQPPTIGKADRLLVHGSNLSSQDRILVIRIDDSEEPVYAQRVNLERVVPPGPFQLSVPLNGLRTPSGRTLQTDRLRRIICFTGHGAWGLNIEPPRIQAAVKLPDGAIGWDLGPEGSPLWPGFEPMDDRDAALSGAMLKAMDRSRRQHATEGLTSDGIRGIEHLTLPLPKGRWFVTLWLHDRGEWEYLPHPLARSIMANGKPVWSEQHTADSWIREVYLAGRSREYGFCDDAWTLYGEQPEGRVSFKAQVGNSGLQLAFSGHMPEAGYVAGILAEPEAHYPVRASVEERRAHWWRNNWRIKARPDSTRLQPGLDARQETITAAPGTSTSLTFDLFPAGLGGVPRIEINPPTLGGRRLESQLRWGHWQLRRSTLSSTLLQPVDTHLRGDGPPPEAPDGAPRRLHLQLDIPPDTPAGRYHGRIRVTLGDAVLSQPLVVDVPAVLLPQPDRPVGVYLERPVHFGWFEETSALEEQALRCDLEQLRRLGLTGISPGFSTPRTPAEAEHFVRETRVASEAGFLPPYLAYAPVKRLMAEIGLQATASQLAETQIQLLEQELPMPAWSIADEPSNPGQADSLARISRYTKSHAPCAVLAGHLNHPDDDKHLEHLDLALVNGGFGVDETDIRRIKDNGAIPWLYNMEHKRAAAGFYLWRVDARGYLQWHARMPTADPFDPTDGREDDVQFLYPVEQPCPQVPDLDASLFELVEGITDLRWLLWLEREAEWDTRAAGHLWRLRAQIPDNWDEMSRVAQGQLDQWRESIIRLVTSDL